MRFPSRPRVAALAVVASLASPGLAHAGGFALVTNGHNGGPGSLRHALEVKEASTVVILPAVEEIEIWSTVQYGGRAPLTLVGTGQTVRTEHDLTLLAVTEGADLRVSNLDFQGPGGFSINNRGDLDGEAGKGIFVDVRDDQRGRVNVMLTNVGVSGVANHGIHVSDCDLADACGSGGGGGGDGSRASISVVLNGVTVDDVGNGKFDADGLRVDERGEGDIIAFIRNASFTRVGADGVELDEGDDGKVRARAFRSDFSNNGAYCDPDLLAAFLPVPDEAEFDESEEVTEDAIPPQVSDSPDNACFEREVDFYDSGFVEAYEFGIDVDDGIDIDEAGAGSLVTSMVRSTIGDNLDEGVDFDEEDAGDARVRFVNTDAFGNADDGFKVSEAGEGAVLGAMRRATSTDNGGKGAVFEEEDEGDLFVSVVGTTTAGNDDEDDTGIEAAQEEPGTGKLRVRASDISDGIDTDGVDEI